MISYSSNRLGNKSQKSMTNQAKKEGKTGVTSQERTKTAQHKKGVCKNMPFLYKENIIGKTSVFLEGLM